MPVFEPIRTYIDGLVHPSVRADALVTARHRAFIGTHLAAGVAALALLPVYLAVRGAPDAAAVVALAWLASPLALAWFLSASGRFATAHLASAVAHAGLALTLAAVTGGPASPAMAWLVVIPLQASLSGRRRVMIGAGAIALAALLGMFAADAFGLVPPAAAALPPGAIMLAVVLAAVVYGTMLALGSGALLASVERLQLLQDARYRLLAEHMTDLVTRHAPNGAVTFVSPAAESLLGVAPSELAADGLFARVHVADRPAYLSALSRATAEGEPGAVEFRLRRGSARDGAEAGHVWVEMRCRPLEDGVPHGTRRQVVAVTRDISERKRQEKTLDLARCEAERANRAKTRFLATMTHELRTPLNAIIGFAEILINERRMPLDAQKRGDYARLIHESGHHLLGVVNGILDVSRIESGNFDVLAEPFALKPVVDGCCEMMALKAQAAGLSLVADVDDRLPEIVADRRALKQILINLISNAVKFTKPGGTVTVRAAIEGGDVCLAVADTGIGIDAADLPRLGAPFFQCGSAYDRPFEGSGLGLSVVKGLVELHGGRLEIASRLGEGTLVTVRLPRDGESAGHPARAAAVVTALPRRAHQDDAVAGDETREIRKRA
ncbi:PAS domain-containing sensor histidine kinase [Blastochloris sulfoviridis]|uniref:histidine kinase n=1 Tax=Blastochloris sulfoviridis TaxID=50712 RepID=A0A5M6I4Z5_9HYPH|nr:PAS domain-containing sensor histidine kinase [Blastochloris sulfoviridis]KAA5602848.1 PAS domain S-box protein [Blastochloris sulfoviridis]